MQDSITVALESRPVVWFRVFEFASFAIFASDAVWGKAVILDDF
jgi:hypothetical protein